jgi:aminopeptidase N
LSTNYVGHYYYNNIKSTSKFWDQSIADPKRPTMFSSAVYYRGGMTLAALRHLIGSTTFFALLTQWTAEHKYGNANTAQFIALAEQMSGMNLDKFFHAWLYSKTKPASFDVH